MTLIWFRSADYKPFGEATVTVSAITNNLRFPGQYYDAETGLHQNGFRDYSPPTGKYLTPDSINIGSLSQYKARQSSNVARAIDDLIAKMQFDPQEQNLYAYATNNPVRFVDPFGLSTLTDCQNNCQQGLTGCIWLVTVGQVTCNFTCYGLCMAATDGLGVLVCRVACMTACASAGGPALAGCNRAYPTCMSRCSGCL